MIGRAPVVTRPIARFGPVAVSAPTGASSMACGAAPVSLTACANGGRARQERRSPMLARPCHMSINATKLLAATGEKISNEM
jgi:hypothetical protein